MEQQQEKKFFNAEDSILNADDALFAVSQNSWVNAENLRFATTDKDATQAGQFIGGTKQLSSPQPSVNYIANGSAADDENGRIAEFKFNTTGRQDKIVVYYKSTGIEYDALLSSQVTGGLNFSSRSFIHSAVILNGMLYWVDGTNNQPRKINLESAIKANNPSFVTNETPYAFPLLAEEITIIKAPPAYSPNIIKATDAAFDNNFIANQSFEAAYEFVYYDNEETVVGTYSQASRLNFPTDTYNFIEISMDNRQYIPSTVRLVNLVIREQDGTVTGGNIAKVVKTWDKEVASEAAEIAAQNAGATLLTFDFYNDITGSFLPKPKVLRPFDNVPIYSLALAAAKNKIFLGNNTEGYDTPTITSMSLSLGTQITLDVTDKIAFLFIIRQRYFDVFDNPSTPWAYSAYWVYLPWAAPAGWYLLIGTNQTNFTFGVITPYPTLPPAPTTRAISSLQFLSADLNTALFNQGPPGYPSNNNTDNAISPNLLTITGTTPNKYNVMAQKSPYGGGIAFYDEYLRKCAVVTNDGVMVSTPARDYDYTTAIAGINWTLSNANPTAEIPLWAKYYAPLKTLNLRTRSFVQAYSFGSKYVTKDLSGVYQFNSLSYINTAVAIGINTVPLYQAGLGYVFTEGDVCIVIRDDNTTYELPVIGQEGNYILLKPKDIGLLGAVNLIFEVYTPYQTSEQEPYFEQGELNRVLNPGTALRRYETTFGFFASDTYAFTRNWGGATYFAGAMSPNDLFYKRWDTDAGKVNIVSKLGQVVKDKYISWSNSFIPNTAVNGLSAFEATNQKPVPEDCGGVYKLVNTSKAQAEGTVMLAICANETCSLYLQETQIIDSTGQTQFFTASDEVISTLNVLKGSRGTTHPESVVPYRGNVYWWDNLNSRIVQYSLNGLFDISDYKMTRFWGQLTLQFNSLTVDEIEALGSRPFVFSAVDPYHEELLFSIPKLSNTPPKGYLPDYPTKIYPFDILDFQGKTIVYKLDMGVGKPKWVGSFSFNPECFSVLQSELYSNKYGHLYLHNQPNYNEFYGAKYSSKIMVVSNAMLNNPKVYNNNSVECNLPPSFVYLYNSYPVQQSSDLVDLDYKAPEGIWYAKFYRNKLLPTEEGYTSDGLLTGEPMRNTNMLIMYEWRVESETQLQLKFINIGFKISLGNPV